MGGGGGAAALGGGGAAAFGGGAGDAGAPPPKRPPKIPLPCLAGGGGAAALGGGGAAAALGGGGAAALRACVTRKAPRGQELASYRILAKLTATRRRKRGRAAPQARKRTHRHIVARSRAPGFLFTRVCQRCAPFIVQLVSPSSVFARRQRPCLMHALADMRGCSSSESELVFIRATSRSWILQK